MSVTKRPNGRWRARWREHDGTQRARHFATRREAEDFLATVRTDQLRGTYIDPTEGRRTTFGEFAERWRLAQPHRPSTAESTESRLNVHVLPTWKDRPLAGIRPSEVQAWITGVGQRLAPTTTEGVLRLFATIMRAAVADGLVAKSPVVGVKLPRQERRLVVPLDPAMVLQLAGAIRPELGPAVMASAAGGLRISEVAGLTVDRVDFFRGTITVDRQMTWPAGKGWQFGPPKTPASRREVPVPGSLVHTLSAHLAEHPAGEHGLIFARLNGEPWRRRMMAESFTAAVKKAGAPEGTTWHDLRHFYASALIAAGTNVKAVQRRLGHATAAETLDTYSHLFPDEDDRTRATIEASLWPSEDRLRTNEA